MKDVIIFDLDGTLLDTSPGILESVRYAAETLGYPALPTEQLLSFIGPPLTDSFVRCYGCGRAEGERLTAAYRAHYREGALLNAEPYAGIFELCERLRGDGFRLAVATSKPQLFSEQILAHFGFGKYLDEIHGADMAGRLSKADLIRLCLGGGPAGCFMVGDTEHDARGALEAGVPFIGVRYGFGSRDEMAKLPSVGLASTPAEVYGIIQRERRRLT